MERYAGWAGFAACAVVTHAAARPGLKGLLAAPLRVFLRATAGVRESLRRVYAHAHLAAQMTAKLPVSVVVLGRVTVSGTGRVSIGEECYLSPDVCMETQEDAALVIGDGVVLSRGVHLVAMAGITVGRGSMIGEYTSIRDANHRRLADVPLRDGGHTAKAVVVGEEVWIGRGVTVLGGVTIGDRATVGANAVVTKDVAAGAVVAGVPARPIRSEGGEG